MRGIGIDWKARRAEPLGRCPAEVMGEVRAKLATLLGCRGVGEGNGLGVRRPSRAGKLELRHLIARYDELMDIGEIQHAIEALSPEQQMTLLDWLAERDRREWDAQIERDFSPGGAGMHLLARVRAQVRGGESVSMNKDR